MKQFADVALLIGSLISLWAVFLHFATKILWHLLDDSFMRLILNVTIPVLLVGLVIRLGVIIIEKLKRNGIISD